MNHVNMLKIVCMTAVITFDENVLFAQTKIDAGTAYLDEVANLEEAERQYMAEDRGYAEPGITCSIVGAGMLLMWAEKQSL